MSTITIYGDTSDSVVYCTDPSSYANARSGAGSLFTSTGLQVGQEKVVSTFFCYESCVAFDTSTVTQAPYGVTAQLYLDTNATTTDFVMEARAYDWGPTADTADFRAGANLGTYALLGQAADSSTWGASGYIDVNEVGVAFRGGIVLGGVTRFILSSDRMRLGTTPTTSELGYFRDSEETGTTQDPKLILVTGPNTSTDNILNPDIDVAVNSWTTDTGGASSLYAAIDEATASDTDYIRSPIAPTSSQYYETWLETQTDPASSSGHIVHYRYKKNVAAGVVDLAVSLRQAFDGGQNLLTTNQAGLETDLTGWSIITSGPNSILSASTEQAHTGTKSLRAEAGAGSSGATVGAQTPTGTSGIPVVGSSTYFASVWLRGVITSGQTVRITIEFYDSVGGGVFPPSASTDTLSTGITVSNSVWQQLSFSFETPAAAAYAAVLIYTTASTVGHVMYYDDFVLSTPVVASWNHTDISSSWVTQDQTLSGGQADSITDYSALRLRFTPNTVMSDVVPTFVSDRASANSNSTVTTVDLVLSGLTVGNFLIVRSAADNSGGGGAARSFALSNLTGTPIDTATDVAFQQNNDPGAASAGVTANLGIAKITATSGTVRITYGGAVVQACVAEEWSGLDNAMYGNLASANGVNSTTLASLGSVTINMGNVAYAMEAVEGPSTDTYTQDTDTNAGSWSSLTKVGTTNATADTNQTTYGGYKTVTSLSTQMYDPTINNARDSAGHLVELLAGTSTIRTQVSWANLELPAESGSFTRTTANTVSRSESLTSARTAARVASDAF